MANEAPALLQARTYGQMGDYDLIGGWYRARHDAVFPETILPPLGVVIEREGEPVGALWCYESFGIGVAFLEFALTRPGLALAEARRVMDFAVCAISAVIKPRGYGLIIAHTLPAIARILESTGWTAGGEKRTVLKRIN